MKVVEIVAAVLLIVGGLNWGLVGLFHFDLVATLLGEMTVLSRIVYGLVGISGIYLAASLWNIQKRLASVNSR
jgi:uncharacterized membrane protein YuzA (DUF378 family)